MYLIWIGFFVLVIGLLALDLGVFHRKSHVISIREALAWTAFWVVLSLIFNVLVYFMYQHHWLGIGLEIGHNVGGREAAQLFLSGYLLEKSLSVDNIFVIAMIFSYFAVPAMYQHRVLFWGIVGALVMRGIMIWVGTELVAAFEWMIYVFGGLLILSAIKMLITDAEHIEPDHNPLVRAARRLYPVTAGFRGPHFVVFEDGRRMITPLFLVLLVIESTDLLFAVDSIPAVLVITRDPFLVFTSNVFAILGLRSLYFALAGMMDKFRYLKLALVVLLIVIGVKMLISHWVPIPTSWSLWSIGAILGVGVGVSLLAGRRGEAAAGPNPLEAHGPTPVPPSDPDSLEELPVDSETPVGVTVARTLWQQCRRVIVAMVGGLLVLTGLLLGWMPFVPAIIIIPLGLAILATEFVWAGKLLKVAKDKLRSLRGR